MLVVVLACFASCISLNIISLHQECYLYMLLINNSWNQVSPFWQDTDNGITNSIHIVLRSRHNPRTGHGTMLIDDSPQNFEIAHGINMNDAIYHYEWKCQSAWQLHKVFERCDTIVISYDLILCYGIGMQSQLCKTIDILDGASYMFVALLACFANCTSFNIISLHQECCLICCYEIIDGIRFLRFGMILILELQTQFT